MIKKLIHIVLLFIFSFGLSGQVSISVDQEVRSISPHLIGINGRSTEGPSWDDAAFLSMVEKMYPGTVRYPAGTQANYWDWRTGTFIEGCGKTAKYNFSVSSFTEGLPPEATIIYVVNMARPTPATGVDLNASETVLRSDETLQLKIEDMLAALAEFERSGRFPEAIELGNEFYFDNEHAAIYAANPGFYMRHAKLVCKAVKAEYPDLKILLCTTKGGTRNRDDWNNTIFNALQTDSELAVWVQGVVQHHYINDKYGDPAVVTSVEKAKTAIAEGFQYAREHAVDYDLVPDDLALWLTEYGATKHNADGAWTAGLRAVAMTMGWMEMGQQIERLFYHHITDDPNMINKANRQRGPVGMALGLLGKAARGKNRLQRINFANNPFVSGEVEALHGFKFRNQEQEAVFILNLGDERFEDINVDGLFMYEGNRNTTIYSSSVPYETPVYEGHGIRVESGVADETGLNIPPFSVTLIVTDNSTGDERFNVLNPVKVYPSVFTSSFHVEIPEGLKASELTLTNMSGAVCYRAMINKPVSQHSPDVVPGLYILTIQSQAGPVIRKLVKR